LRARNGKAPIPPRAMKFPAAVGDQRNSGAAAPNPENEKTDHRKPTHTTEDTPLGMKISGTFDGNRIWIWICGRRVLDSESLTSLLPESISQSAL